MMIKWPYLSSIGTSTYCILGCLFLGFSPTLPYNWQMFKLERPKDWVRRALTFSLWQLPHLALDQSFGDIPCSLVVIWHSNLRLRIMVQLVTGCWYYFVARNHMLSGIGTNHIAEKKCLHLSNCKHYKPMFSWYPAPLPPGNMELFRLEYSVVQFVAATCNFYTIDMPCIGVW